VEASVGDLTASGAGTFTDLAVPTLSELRRALLREQFHVMHYMGHGAFTERDGGRPVRRDRGHAGPSRHPRGDRDAVRGHRYRRDRVRTGAVRGAGGRAPGGRRSREARKAIYAVSALEWATPVLYLRADDARLFDITQAPLVFDHIAEGERQLRDRRYVEDADRRAATSDSRQVIRLLEQALQIIYQESDISRKASIMAGAAEVMVCLDHDRAAKLSVDAECLSPQNDKSDYSEITDGVIEALAVTDLDLAERIVQSISAQGQKMKHLREWR
jgi:hypothetical protein